MGIQKISLHTGLQSPAKLLHEQQHAAGEDMEMINC